MLDILNQLFDSGVYAKLYKAGLVSAKLSTYRDYYNYVDAQLRTRSITKTAAVIEASVKYDCSVATIWGALSAIEKLSLN